MTHFLNPVAVVTKVFGGQNNCRRTAFCCGLSCQSKVICCNDKVTRGWRSLVYRT